MAHLAFFSYNIGPHAQSVVMRNGWYLLHQESIIKKFPADLPTNNLMEIFPNDSSFY